MTTLLVTNIGELVTWDDDRPILHDAAFVVVAFDDMVVGLRVHRQLANKKWGQVKVEHVPVTRASDVTRIFR